MTPLNMCDLAYPVKSLLPRQTTQALQFIEKTGCDGNGVIVAIIDTGVDPAADGLQKTTDNKQKIIDIVDCTGSGDVELSDWQEVPKETLTHRPLKAPSHIKQCRLGKKSAKELYPKDLWDHVQKERREKLDDITNKLCKTIRDEDIDFYYDVLVYKEDTLKCMISTDGDFTKTPALQDYAVDYSYYLLPEVDLTATVKFYKEDVCICTNAGPHGTHVAAITGANMGERSGVAPGCQIISLKIGDHRLSGMETQLALHNVIKYLKEHHVDICNMSFGEAMHIPNHGYFTTELKKLVKKGLFFVTSAGNAGPCLHTIGAPASSSHLISVGAHVHPDQIIGEYGLLNTYSMPYYWSSRSPTVDGHVISCYAPGSAITSVPKYLKWASQLMNGTSMASPNAAGSFALLKSALNINPFMSQYVCGPRLDYKIPFIHLLETLDYYKTILSLPFSQCMFDISTRMGRGIHLEVTKNTTEMISISIETQASFDERVEFPCQIKAPAYIQAPQFLFLSRHGKSFQIKILLDALPIGCTQDTIDLYYQDHVLCRVPLTLFKCTDSLQHPITIAPGELKRIFIHPKLNGLTLHGHKDIDIFTMCLLPGKAPIQKRYTKPQVVQGMVEICLMNKWTNMDTISFDLRIELEDCAISPYQKHFPIHTLYSKPITGKWTTQHQVLSLGSKKTLTKWYGQVYQYQVEIEEGEVAFSCSDYLYDGEYFYMWCIDGQWQWKPEFVKVKDTQLVLLTTDPNVEMTMQRKISVDMKLSKTPKDYESKCKGPLVYIQPVKGWKSGHLQLGPYQQAIETFSNEKDRSWIKTVAKEGEWKTSDWYYQSCRVLEGHDVEIDFEMLLMAKQGVDNAYKNEVKAITNAYCHMATDMAKVEALGYVPKTEKQALSLLERRTEKSVELVWTSKIRTVAVLEKMMDIMVELKWDALRPWMEALLDYAKSQ